MNHAIVCVSIGKRPWTKYTFSAMERYAKNINSDLPIGESLKKLGSSFFYMPFVQLFT